MTEGKTAIEELVRACPSFRGTWTEFLADPGSFLPYVVAGDFADHLLDRYRAGDTASLQSVGKALEGLILDGSEWVREFAVIGVLEGIQNRWANDGADPDVFRQWLGPAGAAAWTDLNDFWQRRTPDSSAPP